MPLPAAIVESFAENPPLRDIDYVESDSILNTLNENSPQASILEKASRMMGSIPRTVESKGALRQDYSTTPGVQNQFYGDNDNGREIPDTATLFKQNIGQKIQNQQPTRLVEQQYVQQPQNQVAQAIDYSLIKMMIESAVSNAMKEFLPKEIDHLKIGSTIKFVAKDGGVYEGKLNKIGTVK